jgi:hypothetical protein
MASISLKIGMSGEIKALLQVLNALLRVYEIADRLQFVEY